MFIDIVSIIAGIYVGVKRETNIIEMAYYFVTDSNALLAVLTGICMFMVFKNLNIKYNKFINTIAQSTFGVLCIHANSDAMRQWLWKDTLRNLAAYEMDYFIFHACFSVVCVFAICIVIDYIRIHLIEKPMLNWYDIVERKLKYKFIR